MAEQSPRRGGVLGRALDRVAQRVTAPQAEEARGIRQEMRALRKAVEGLTQRIEDLDARAARVRAAADEGTTRELASLKKQTAALLEHDRKSDRTLERRSGELTELREAIKDSIKNSAVDLMTMARVHKSRQDQLAAQLAALLRATYLATDLPASSALQVRRFRLLSQNEEDGITLALLEATGAPTRTFVEIGSGSSGGNSATLAFEMGWRGLMIEGNARLQARLRSKLQFNPQVTVLNAMVTPENVNALLREQQIPPQVDLLSIDVDSVDYWILQAVECTARVLVLEYNAFFGPTRSVTLPPDGRRVPRDYFGASLTALDSVARRKGYGLVLCEPTGTNAFFVRDGLAPELRRLSPEQAYQPPAPRGKPVPSPDAVFMKIKKLGLPLVEV